MWNDRIDGRLRQGDPCQSLVRALIDETHSTGYHSDAEMAYRWEEIPDYHLLPAGRLRRGEVRVDLAQMGSLSPTGSRDMVRAFEKPAGVEHQSGRSLYGPRGPATDLAPELAQDAQVLKRLIGHLDSATRYRVYRDPMQEEVLAQAANVRRQIREYPRDGTGNRNGISRPPKTNQPRVIPPLLESEKPHHR